MMLAVNGFTAEPEKWALMQRAVLNEQNLDKIKSLVASGVDPNAPIGCGTYAPLNGAISQGNLKMVALLLSLKARPTDTQMVEAVSVRTPDALKMVKMLLAAGASINARDYYSKEENLFSSPIHKAVYRGDHEMIAYLLGQNGIELNNPDVDDSTPLMSAIKRGDETTVDMLLAAGADPRQKNREGLDPATVAADVIKKQQAFIVKLSQVRSASAKRRTETD